MLQAAKIHEQEEVERKMEWEKERNESFSRFVKQGAWVIFSRLDRRGDAEKHRKNKLNPYRVGKSLHLDVWAGSTNKHLILARLGWDGEERLWEHDQGGWEDAGFNALAIEIESHPQFLRDASKSFVFPDIPASVSFKITNCNCSKRRWDTAKPRNKLMNA
jgi:hypothetical protein